MTNTDSTTVTDKQQYWLEHLRACDASDLTTIDYARAHGINVKSLYSARKGLVEKGTPPRPQPSHFQKAQLVNHSLSLDSQWQVRLTNGAVVAFSGAVDAATLSLVLNTTATLS